MEIAFFFFTTLYLILFIYLLLGWGKLFKSTTIQKLEPNEYLFISIVCPFRNEVKNLPSFLESIEIQNYPRDKFELILVNDHSEDGGLEYLDSYLPQTNYNIHKHSLNDGEYSKKIALTRGIETAKGQLILTTDCDTTRTSNWLSSTNKGFKLTKADMLIGPVKIEEGNTFICQYQSLEFLSLQVVTASFIGNKNPILCNGANLAFTKDAYLKVDGYVGQKTASGDDFFLLMKFKKDKMTISFNTSLDSIVVVKPTLSFSEFIQQRLRWAGKTIYAKDTSIYFTGFFNSFFALFLLFLPIYEVFTKGFPFFSILIYSTKFVGDWILLKKAANRYNLRYRFKDLLFTFLSYPLYISYIFMQSLSTKPTWKGRKI